MAIHLRDPYIFVKDPLLGNLYKGKLLGHVRQLYLCYYEGPDHFLLISKEGHLVSILKEPRDPRFSFIKRTRCRYRYKTKDKLMKDYEEGRFNKYFL